VYRRQTASVRGARSAQHEVSVYSYRPYQHMTTHTGDARCEDVVWAGRFRRE
jgi:hypothetical protein